ncbi:MAG TPA: 2-hydroxyacid dehydrogenase [Candidatus Deferrimicrobiaceae bacterium]|nr:2-hydroxyacid dehydrogenase [Candidatus Deferrimicrobiaceae bacterium]
MATRIILSPKLPPALLDIARSLVPAGFEMVVVDAGTPEFTAALPDAAYYVGFPRAEINNEFFKAAPGLKLVQLISAGYDRLDVAAAKRAGVPVANNGGSNSVAVAEHTLMLMLAVYRKLSWHHANVVTGKWRVGDLASHRLYELEGKTLGIVGLGTIGKKVARRAAAFGMRILYYDIVRLAEDAEDALGVRFVLFPELLRTSDIVSLHVPLNAVTRNLIGARELAMMRPAAVLINTCRGPVVDETALHAALTGGRIAAAGLDVMVEEPPVANHPLFALENVTFTPHMAGPTWDNWFKAFRNAFDNVQRVARGERPLWVIPELR